MTLINRVIVGVNSGLKADITGTDVRVNSVLMDKGSIRETTEVGSMTGRNIRAIANNSTEVVSIFPPLVAESSSVIEAEDAFVMVVNKDHRHELPRGSLEMVIMAEDGP
jgi:hypothetical protein